ncbi:MAG: hypothetical protein WCF23_11395 [Candidatus Nitrosopolaris sp.]
MEKTLISLKEFPIREEKIVRQKDRRRTCVFCGNLVSHEAIFRVEGASLVEWYCTLHIKELEK